MGVGGGYHHRVTVTGVAGQRTLFHLTPSPATPRSQSLSSRQTRMPSRTTVLSPPLFMGSSLPGSGHGCLDPSQWSGPAVLGESRRGPGTTSRPLRGRRVPVGGVHPRDRSINLKKYTVGAFEDPEYSGPSSTTVPRGLSEGTSLGGVRYDLGPSCVWDGELPSSESLTRR